MQGMGSREFELWREHRMGRDRAPMDGRSWLTAKGETDAVGDGCQDEVVGGRSAGATIAAGQNRRVGSPLRLCNNELSLKMNKKQMHAKCNQIS